MDNSVSELQQSLSRAAKADKARRFHSLYDKVYREDVLLEAWNRVRKNKGSAGTDGKTIEDIEKEGAELFLKQMATELKERTYEPSPLKRVWIPKPSGKKRGLGIPTVKDRVVQSAVKLVIEPIFEADFEPNSYGFRPDRSAIGAVDEVVKWLNFGYETVIDADIAACFDTIPKGRLIEQVARRVSDGAILRIIKQWIEVGVMGSESLSYSNAGTPQGSPISPLLANIYLDQLDKGWKQTGIPYRFGKDAHLVRYADDFVILGKDDMVKSMHELDRIIQSIGLSLNKAKTRILEAEQGLGFLGFWFVRHYSKKRGKRVTNWFPSGESKEGIMERIRELTDKSNLSVGTPYDAKENVARVLRGWGNYFRHSKANCAFSAIWGYADRRMGRLNRRWHHKDHIGRYRNNVALGLSVQYTRPKPVPYMAYNAAR